MKDWRKHWNEVEVRAMQSIAESLRQVGKTVTGQPVQPHQIDLIAETIMARLELGSEDVVVDLGCGNGLLTQRVAQRIAWIAGIDVSTPLLSVARAWHTQSNCSYHVGDLAMLGPLPVPEVTKAYCYEVLQHLTTAETQAMLEALRDQLGDRLILFAGSIPERSKLRMFYNTPSRWSAYELSEAEETEPIGHWWDRDELTALCSELGLTCEPCDQATALYTSHYRFDAMIVAR